MNSQFKKRLERLELETRERRERGTTKLDIHALASALTVALKDYPEELAETFAHLSNGRLSDAKDVLEHLTTGDEDRHALTPRAVGGVIHLLMCGALDTGENIADRMREPLIEYCGDNEVLQETIVLLLCDLTGDGMVFRDNIVAFAYLCMNGHAFRIDGRREKRRQ